MRRCRPVRYGCSYGVWSAKGDLPRGDVCPPVAREDMGRAGWVGGYGCGLGLDREGESQWFAVQPARRLWLRTAVAGERHRRARGGRAVDVLTSGGHRVE